MLYTYSTSIFYKLLNNILTGSVHFISVILLIIYKYVLLLSIITKSPTLSYFLSSLSY